MFKRSTFVKIHKDDEIIVDFERRMEKVILLNKNLFDWTHSNLFLNINYKI